MSPRRSSNSTLRFCNRRRIAGVFMASPTALKSQPTGVLQLCDQGLGTSLLQPGDHLAVVDQTRLLEDERAVVHDDEVWNAHDIETLSEVRPPFRVYFEDDRPARHLRGNPLNLRGCLAAGPT